MTPFELRAGAVSDVEALARLLTRASLDDPGFIAIEGDRDRRRTALPTFFRTFVAAAHSESGDLVVAGDPIRGIASWFGADRHGPTPDAMGANGFSGVLETLGPEGGERLLGVVGELEAQHERLIQGPHLRLEFFGVEPGQQGSGIGSALIEHGHRRADALHLPCYLETFTLSNVRFYEHRGYAVVGEWTVGDGVPVYGLVRRAAATTG